jgi:hypothetical protein
MIPVLTGSAAPMWDALDYYAPAFSLIADHVKHGRLLLWDPWINGGSPDFAEPQAGAASPIILLFGLVFRSPTTGFAFYWLALWLFGGLGALRLAKHLGSGPVWGLISALTFTTSGFYCSHAEHTAILYSFSFLPWLVWRFDAAISTGGYAPGLQAGMLLGLSGLGGYPQLVILDPFFLGLWAIGRILFAEGETVKKDRGRQMIFAVRSLVIVGITAAIVLSPSYISFMRDTRGYSDRISARSREEALRSNLFPPAAAGTIFSPFLHLLNLPPIRLWPETDATMSNAYVSGIGLIFATLGVFQRKPFRWWLAGLIALFACCTVGYHLPVRAWLYDYVPPTRYFRNPSLFMAYPLLLVAVLAALAGEDMKALLEPPRRVLERVRTLVPLSLAVTAVCLFIQTTAHAKLPAAAIAWAWLHIAVVWFLVGGLAWAWRMGGLSPAHLNIVLVPAIVFEATLALYVSHTVVFSDFTAAWWHNIESQHKTDLSLKSYAFTRHLHPPSSIGTYPNNRNIWLKDPELDNYAPMRNTFQVMYQADTTLSSFATADSKAWFSDDPVWTHPSETAFSAFEKRCDASHGVPLLLHNDADMTRFGTSSYPNLTSPKGEEIDAAKLLRPATIAIQAYGPNRFAFTYNADHNGWLLVTDRWANRWTATVNGIPRPVICGDFLFRAIPVQSGPNKIEFRYRDPLYVFLIVLSWLTLCVIAMHWAVTVYRRSPGITPPYALMDDRSDLAGQALGIE